MGHKEPTSAAFERTRCVQEECLKGIGEFHIGISSKGLSGAYHVIWDNLILESPLEAVQKHMLEHLDLFKAGGTQLRRVIPGILLFCCLYLFVPARTFASGSRVCKPCHDFVTVT